MNRFYNQRVPKEPRQQAQLLVTCLVDSLFPKAGEAVVDVLERLGVEVVFPEAQTCCGQPAYNGGFSEEARRLALHTLTVLEASPAPVVVPSGSCAAMVVKGYPHLFSEEPALRARAEAVAARTYEFSQFLTDVLRVDLADYVPSRSPTTAQAITYHPSCHLLRELNVTEAPTRLLGAVPGLTLVPLPGADQCCGFGGLFAVKHDAISAAMLDKKLANVRATGASTVVGCDMSCLMHMEGALVRDGQAIRCRHLAEVVAEAMDDGRTKDEGTSSGKQGRG
jgi:L-lactate dehydrogenase complex protein LldE